MSEQKNIANSRVVFPFFKGIMFPIEELIHHFRSFLCLAGIVALCYSLITFMLEQNYLCFVTKEKAGIFCLDSSSLVILVLLLWGMLLAYFINRWYLIIKCGVSVRKALFVTCWKKDFKTFGFIVAYLGLWLLIGIVIYVLRQRVATPNWMVELLYFTIGAIIVLVSVVLLLNSVLFVRFLQGKDWLVLKQTLLPVFDNVYKIVAYFLFYLLLFVYLLYFKIFFITRMLLPLWIGTLLGNMLTFIVVCALMVCFVASLEFQEKQIFFNKEINQK